MIKKIILAEDDRGVALLVKRQLERQGFVVTVANNGREALNYIREKSFDLLITDVVMPEMDGVDLYLALKKDKKTASLPIIIVTDKDVFRKSFGALGVDHFVEKTLDFDVLLDKIYQVSRLKEQTRNYKKIIVYGSRRDIVDQMSDIFRKEGCLVSSVDNPLDVFSLAGTIKPHIILLDMIMSVDVSINEVIRSLRCYEFLKNTAIAIYFSIPPNEIGMSQNMLESLKEEIKACRDVGATKFLGRFNRVTFLDSLKEFGIS